MFEVDFRVGELRKRGVKVKLQDQPLQVLRMLLDHPGEIVTRDELRQTIWPADTFVDFEQGLYNAIRRLRGALKDSPNKPRFIETLSRRGYRFIGTIDTTPQQIRSLVVLPLEDLSHNPQQEYFAEGLTEALITTIAKIGSLRIVSRTSAMQYKGVCKPPREIAKELKVDAIVEGTVLRVGRRVRITAQLIDARDERHLWAESYDRDLSDVLTLQTEVAQAIATEVRVKLTPEERVNIIRTHPVDAEAYETYLKGRYHWKLRGRGELGKALQSFEQAVTKDPRYAPAYTGLADCLSVLGWWSFISPEEGCGKAKHLAARALELDEGLAEAHVSQAWVKAFYDYDFSAAEKEFKRSIEISPSLATAHLWFGLYLGMMGRQEEAYTEIKTAGRLDPHSMVNQILGLTLLSDRRFDEAIVQFEEALDLDGSFAPAHFVGLSNAYSFKSLHEEAIAAGKKAVELSQGGTLFLGFLGEAYAAAGDCSEAENILDQLERASKERYVSAYGFVRIYAILGANEEAFRWMESAYREHTGHLVWLKRDPRVDKLRPDPRFQDLLRRMNFPP